MFWRTTRVSRLTFVILALLGLLFIAVIELSFHTVRARWFDEKLEASKLAERAQKTLWTYISSSHIPVDTIADPNATGLIGSQFTLITTDQGVLEAKLTTTNPNWAAVVVDMLKTAGVKKGDYVAISYTGSMPGLNIAVLAAVQTIGAIPVIISSVGASMWGATNPEFSWLDMERILFERGIFKYRSTAASIGGRGDRGANLSPKGREICREIIKRNGVTLIEEPTLIDAIKKRVEIYMEKIPKDKKYKAYINVGGGLASIGSAHNLSVLKPGVIKRLPRFNYPIRGAMIIFGLSGVPIINLTSVTELARKYGLPIAPQPIPDVPSGDVFYKKKYRLQVVALLLLIYALVVFVVLRIDVKKYLSHLSRGRK